jgi:hypothetical protein
MNRTAVGFLILERAIEGYLQFKNDQGLSPKLLEDIIQLQNFDYDRRKAESD